MNKKDNFVENEDRYETTAAFTTKKSIRLVITIITALIGGAFFMLMHLPVSGFILIAGALGLSLLLTKLQPVSQATALLSLAPGGMDQMGIIAHEVNADLSMVNKAHNTLSGN
jgi:uncharacterized membrane protein AbrB (regulator of aidB expression)